MYGKLVVRAGMKISTLTNSFAQFMHYRSMKHRARGRLRLKSIHLHARPLHSTRHATSQVSRLLTVVAHSPWNGSVCAL